MYFQFYTALSPIGVYEDFGGPIGDANSFFISYLAAPVVLFFWVCGYIWKRGSLFIKVADIDLTTGRRPVDWDAINAEKARVAAFPAWKRVLYFLF
jgi:amino acid transporter